MGLALSRGERVDRDAAFFRRRGPGEGLVAGEDGSDRLGPSCSMETSNASSFWRAFIAENRYP